MNDFWNPPLLLVIYSAKIALWEQFLKLSHPSSSTNINSIMDVLCEWLVIQFVIILEQIYPQVKFLVRLLKMKLKFIGVRHAMSRVETPVPIRTLHVKHSWLLMRVGHWLVVATCPTSVSVMLSSSMTGIPKGNSNRGLGDLK